MSTALSKDDFKIVYFHLPSQNEEEEPPKGVVVVHLSTGLSGIGEDPKLNTRDNILVALKKMAHLAKIPPGEVESFFSCPTCHLERLPYFENWKSDHSYEYGRIFTANDHPAKAKDVKFKPTPICAAIVFKNEKDTYWFWDVVPTGEEDHEDPLGFSHFVEDAIKEAEKAALEIVNKSLKADELGPRN